MTLRVLIVDDEPVARHRLHRLLQAVGDVELVAECEDGPKAVAAIQAQRPDLVFLDVQMPEMSGFDVLTSVGPREMPAVIFVTAYDRFALQAFEAQALDYLLKPFGEERVRQALERARRFLAGGAQKTLQEQLAALLRATSESRGSPSVLVKKGDRVVVLRPSEIDWIESYGDYVRLHAGQESHLLRGTLSELEQRLAPQGFVRIHRSRLVNWERVKEFTPENERTSTVVLKNGTRLNASQTCLKDLRQRLELIS
jgi:two-component system, LytTR family, response regulator